VEKAGDRLSFDQLSTGEQTIIALVGDLARRLVMANPELNNPLEGDGVVLIDEIDLHLHPSWQKKILPLLSKTFPNCQFIVTTHSPLVLSRLAPNDIFILSANENKSIQAEHPLLAKGLTVNDILSGLMDETANRDDMAEEKLNAINQALEDEDTKTAKNLLAELRIYLDGVNLPEMSGQEATLGMLESEAKNK
jgi:predicted ATP-binding protein involved in virulence